jgi:3-hydroxyisobutyrate dehydrogenase-like beta-hydroxyacid dehydrogenase
VNDIIALGGGRFVDAAIVGPPPGESTDTRLYLSGESVAEIARCFASPGLRIINLGAEIGRASSLKMCHSAMHKGQLAMLLATLAGAESLGVRHELTELWGARANTADLVRDMDENFRRLAKAWRFAGEMDEVADTFASAGVPAQFHVAAGEIFRRLSTLPDAATRTQVFDLLLDPTSSKTR